MFRKSKSKLSPAPTAPNVEEIISDIETFQITTTTAEHNSQEWWVNFEQFLDDVRRLNELDSEIKLNKLKLESCKLEIETEAKLLDDQIEQQQTRINQH